MAGNVKRVAVVLLAAAAVTVLTWLGYSASALRPAPRLQVATVSVQLPPVGSDGAGMTGRLGASRAGQRACFWISDSRGSEPRRYLVFARHYSASPALALLDEQGHEIARASDTVTATISAPRPNSAPQPCPAGLGMTVFTVARPSP